MKRRKFLLQSTLSGIGVTLAGTLSAFQQMPYREIYSENSSVSAGPLVIATWNVKEAVAAAGAVVQSGGQALDAIEAGCNVEEANIKNQTVGKGGLPDREGHVTLDACIMDHKGNCGSVVYLKNITHALSVARKVMEDTPHVMLAGKGAEIFAYQQGFKKENLLTAKSKEAWEKWKVKSEYKPIINIENHDTIGMLAMDKNGNISGGCTTSGLAYKMAGRVGDSPIIGSGLYVDNEVGAAVATGLGEEVVKTVGSFLIVELMRQGYSPQKACEEAIQRIVNKPGSNYKDFQVAYIAINKKGETGSYSIHRGFTMTTYREEQVQNLPSPCFITD